MNRIRSLVFGAAMTVRVVSQSWIAPVDHLGWGANLGWVDALAGGESGMVVGEFVCSGSLYGANFGWILLGTGAPADGVHYSNTLGTDSGVNHLGDGRLRGLAWAANLGWVNFEDNGDPRIDLSTGRLTGRVWSANAGWITLGDRMAGIRTTRLVPSSDRDEDGISDAWELQHCRSLEVLFAGGDADADGAPDVEEYEADTDPFDAGDRLRITEVSWGEGEGAVTWSSKATRVYQVVVTSDVGFRSSTDFDGSAPTPGSVGGSTTLPISLPAGDSGFVRVIALKPLNGTGPQLPADPGDPQGGMVPPER